ncbi:MAG: PilC/PilY family type IV pilus protein [Gammaproteobacteria bacterium]|nr:PilC/PilY family type IV pilus protein [Gammaproteobacteria bacterium]
MAPKKSAVAAFCVMLFCGFPVLADDIEVFFGSGTSAGVTTNPAAPNVLFILDTSGSMRTEVGTSNLTRMQHMKAALHQILDTATGINVGLMRFNDPGGPILFPTAYIDSDITAVTSGTVPMVESRISSGTDDAEETGGVVDLASARLDVVYYGGSVGTYMRRVDFDTDDAEETAGGVLSRRSNSINIIPGQINGFRFRNTGIPKGATIQAAAMQLYANADSADAMVLQFQGELSNDALQFNSANKISPRTRTSAISSWVPDAWTAGLPYITPDIAPLIQEIVNQPGWLEDDLVIIQTASSAGAATPGSREVVPFDRNPAQAAGLQVVWTLGSPATQTMGLRFQNIGIPQGATITSAVVEFTVAQSNTTPYTSDLTIAGFNTGDAPTFSAAANDITARTLTTNTVAWQPGTWTNPDVVQTPDLKTVVQEIVNRSDWCGNNSMGFSIAGTDTVNRIAHSYDGNPQFAPVLKVTYTEPASGGCFNQTLVYRVNGSENDAEQLSNTSVDLTGNVINLSTSQTNGLRFSNILINQGTTILEADLTFVASADDTVASNVFIQGEAADNSLAFVSNNNNITDRALTTASVNWVPGNWIAGESYTSVDIKSVVQEIVNRTGWAPGNNLTLIQTADNGSRRARSFNNQPADAALLRIKVQNSGVAAAPPKLVRTRLKELVDDFTPSGYTPIVDTLYEAASYYGGASVLYGKNRGAQTTFGRLSHVDSYTGGNVQRSAGCTDTTLNSTACADERITGNPVYTTPILDSCQTSHIVLLTDGEANHNNSISLIKSRTGRTGCSPNTGGEACGRELVSWLASTDQNTTLASDQNVKTYTIGFNLDEGGQANAITFLQDLAARGGGNYYSASTSDQLVSAFQKIIRSILNTDTTFVSPGATVNQFNRLTHLNDIYFSVFKPAARPTWPGNLKRYELQGNPAVVVDSQNAPAVDPATGFFAATSQSFWTDTNVVDGNKVELGGAAGRISLTGRKVYTYTGTSQDLSHNTNNLHETNADLTNTLLGIGTATAAYREGLLQWARGVDVNDEDEDGLTTDVRAHMGAPLHSQAVVITYGGTATSQDNTVYLGTNEGYLHAIDSDTGDEVFAFVPQELLPNLDKFYANTVGSALPYGLDGAISFKKVDVNRDNTIDPAAGDSVYIYAGMRRGGRNYYALDVSNRAAPQLKWTLSGGSGDFTELGQTWSTPILATVRVGGANKEVLIFAGGYDPAQDDKVTRSADTQGRAIFMVDAETGALVWSGGHAAGTFSQTFTDMNYSIPSDITVIDMNMDGLVDQMYVGDMGGQLWRFDINNGAAVDALVSGGVIADFALNNTSPAVNDAANNRRFYYAPDVAKITSGANTFLSISIGSGYRAHPLNTTVQDRFYMLRSTDIYQKPATYTKVTDADMYNATQNLIGESTGTALTTEVAALGAAKGWYIDMENSGEKVLAQSVTVNNQVLFTTFEPSVNTSACSTGNGTGRLYVVNVVDATPTINTTGDATLVKADRVTGLARNGIPPSPSVLFPSDGYTSNPVLCIGAECNTNLDFGAILKKTFWREDTRN